jgi:energy-coupling factor transporter ATP-binding protein EcfA2
MIDSIQLNNFKSIADLKIKLAPLTILVGRNGSGKTSILESIALMAQTSTGSGILAGSLKGGEFVDFEDERAIRCKGDDRGKLGLGFSTHVPISPLVEAIRTDLSGEKTWRNSQGKSFTPPIVEWLRGLEAVLETRLRIHDAGLSKGKNLRARKGNYPVDILVKYQFSKDFQDKYRFHRYQIARRFAKYERSSSFIKTSLGRVEGLQDKATDEGKSTIHSSIEATEVFSIGPTEDLFIPFIDNLAFFRALRNELIVKMRSVYYLSAQRGYIPWALDTSQTGTATWVGPKGERTLEILSHLMKPENRKKWLPYGLLLEKFGVKFAWSGWKEKGVLTSNYVDPLLGSPHKLPSLGSGAKQLISVVAQLAYSNPGSTILVEEPETSLHPAHQTLLPILFAIAISEGKQVIITTHSSYFPLSLYQVLQGTRLRGQTNEGKKSFPFQLKVKDVAVYQVQRGRDGLTKAEKLEVDKEGLKEGVPSFIEVEREILGRYLSGE